jgi:hypothetical protein
MTPSHGDGRSDVPRRSLGRCDRGSGCGRAVLPSLRQSLTRHDHRRSSAGTAASAASRLCPVPRARTGASSSAGTLAQPTLDLPLRRGELPRSAAMSQQAADFGTMLLRCPASQVLGSGSPTRECHHGAGDEQAACGAAGCQGPTQIAVETTSWNSLAAALASSSGASTPATNRTSWPRTRARSPTTAVSGPTEHTTSAHRDSNV